MQHNQTQKVFFFEYYNVTLSCQLLSLLLSSVSRSGDDWCGHWLQEGGHQP